MNRSHLVFVLLLLLTVWSCAQESALRSHLPQPDSARGWRFDIEPKRYLPDDLFEYINGEAELYNDYHFVEMVTAAYIQGDDLNKTYTVDISDLGTPLHAFGLYSRLRSPGLAFAEIGDEAVVSELNTRFHKARYFVQINAGSFEEEVRQEMLKAARIIASSLPTATHPYELTLLPQQDQLPHSLQYYTQGMLGQAAFPAGLMAHYAIAGDTVQAFIVFTPSTEISLPAFKTFAVNLKERGNLIRESPGRIEVETTYQGRIFALHHLHWIVGVIGHKKSETAELLTATVISNLGE